MVNDVNHDEQWTDVRMARMQVRVHGDPDWHRRVIREAHVYVARGRVVGLKAIAAACRMDESNVRAARDSDPIVRTLIRKLGGRYYVLTRDLIPLDVALHSRRGEGKRVGAMRKARSGRGRFARITKRPVPHRAIPP